MYIYASTPFLRRHNVFCSSVYSTLIFVPQFISQLRSPKEEWAWNTRKILIQFVDGSIVVYVIQFSPQVLVYVFICSITWVFYIFISLSSPYVLFILSKTGWITFHILKTKRIVSKNAFEITSNVVSNFRSHVLPHQAALQHGKSLGPPQQLTHTRLWALICSTNRLLHDLEISADIVNPSHLWLLSSSCVINFCIHHFLWYA